MNTSKNLMPIPNSSFSELSNIMTRNLLHVYANRRSQQECEKAVEQYHECLRQKKIEEQSAMVAPPAMPTVVV